MKPRALVTGASRGIGAATARLLAANGAAVAVNFLTSEGDARAVVESILKAGGKAIAVRADARDAAQVTSMVDHVTATRVATIKLVASGRAADAIREVMSR